MPQFGCKKKPFSAKQKRKQLQEKRDRKRDFDEEAGPGCRRRGRGRGHGHHHQGRSHHGDHKSHHHEKGHHHDTSGSESGSEENLSVRKMNPQPVVSTSKSYDPNRYRLHFQEEGRVEITRRKELARQPLTLLPEESLEIDIDDIYKPGSPLDMPKRPPWNYNMSKERLQEREERYFREYLETLLEKHSSDELSYFELNLETWRQLWRVLEISDIVLLIADIRHPALHFSPALYNYVTKEMNKSLVLVLNKIDLAPPALVVAWKDFFRERYPDVHIVCFTSFPRDQKEVAERKEHPEKVSLKRRRKGAFTAVGPKQLLEACESIVNGKVDLSEWRKKIEGELAGEDYENEARVTLEEHDGSFIEHHQYGDGVLTIGCCGYPNVGKSSLMNGLVGHKVVSVSKTPGHTKHFQTIYLTSTVRLCDSPGLVFPSLVPKPLQILSGIYPIAQVREPYTPVGFLAERIDLPRILQLRHPELEDEPAHKAPKLRWSAIYICDAWADKRGFLTAKAARHDTYRAANHLLRLALDGRITMCMRPPDFTNRKAFWESAPETAEIAQLQEAHRHANNHSDLEEVYGALHIPDSEEEYAAAYGHHGDSEEEEDSGEEQEEESGSVDVSNPFALLGDD